jgi:hypothetical protein
VCGADEHVKTSVRKFGDRRFGSAVFPAKAFVQPDQIGAGNHRERDVAPGGTIVIGEVHDGVLTTVITGRGGRMDGEEPALAGPKRKRLARGKHPGEEVAHARGGEGAVGALCGTVEVEAGCRAVGMDAVELLKGDRAAFVAKEGQPVS